SRERCAPWSLRDLTSASNLDRRLQPAQMLAKCQLRVLRALCDVALEIELHGQAPSGRDLFCLSALRFVHRASRREYLRCLRGFDKKNPLPVGEAPTPPRDLESAKRHRAKGGPAPGVEPRRTRRQSSVAENGKPDSDELCGVPLRSPDDHAGQIS